MFEPRDFDPPPYPDVQVISLSRDVVYRGHVLNEFPVHGAPTDRGLSHLTLTFSAPEVEADEFQSASSDELPPLGAGEPQVIDGPGAWEVGHAVQRRIEVLVNPQIIRLIYVLPTIVAESWALELERGMVSTYFRGFEFDLYVEESVPFQVDALRARDRLNPSRPISCQGASIERSQVGAMDPRARFLHRRRPTRCLRAGEDEINSSSWRDRLEGMVEALLPERRYLEQSGNRLPHDFDLGFFLFEIEERQRRRFLAGEYPHSYFPRYELSTKRLFVPKVRGRKRFRVRVVDR